MYTNLRVKRRRCTRNSEISDTVAPADPKPRQTIVHTPTRSRLLADSVSTAGILPRKKLFERHGIPERTGYRILKEDAARRGENVHLRGRKRLISDDARDHIEYVENLSFPNATQSHYAVAVAEGVDNKASKRTVQRAMAQHGIGTYMAMQKKSLTQQNIDDCI